MTTRSSDERSGPSKRIRLEGRVRARDEALGVLDDPARVDAHVVGHHVGGEPDAACRGAVAQVAPGVLAAELVGDPVVGDRVRRRHGLGVAAQLLDRAARPGCAPRGR